MNSPANTPGLIASIAELHSILGLPAPKHPFITVMSFREEGIRYDHPLLQQPFTHEYYTINLMRTTNKIQMEYGKEQYQINTGMLCVGPDQVLKMDEASQFESDGIFLSVHPDFFSAYLPAINLKKYGFFSYAVNEGLLLTEEEDSLMFATLENLKNEISNPTDNLANTLIASHVTLLFNYCHRFYNRQFVSLQEDNGNKLIHSLEEILDGYFESKSLQDEGLPSVQYISDKMKFSPNYLSDMLRACTGKSTNQHIQDKAIGKAKRLLYKTNLSIAEIAYSFGFEYPQNFNKFFKRNTRISPQQYRLSVRDDLSI